MEESLPLPLYWTVFYVVLLLEYRTPSPIFPFLVFSVLYPTPMLTHLICLSFLLHIFFPIPPTKQKKKNAASILQASLYQTVINMNLWSTSTVQRREESFCFSTSHHQRVSKCTAQLKRHCGALQFSELSQSLRQYIWEHGSEAWLRWFCIW